LDDRGVDGTLCGINAKALKFVPQRRQGHETLVAVLDIKKANGGENDVSKSFCGGGSWQGGGQFGRLFAIVALQKGITALVAVKRGWWGAVIAIRRMTCFGDDAGFNDVGRAARIGAESTAPRLVAPTADAKALECGQVSVACVAPVGHFHSTATCH